MKSALSSFVHGLLSPVSRHKGAGRLMGVFALAVVLAGHSARADFFDSIYDGLFGDDEEETAPAQPESSAPAVDTAPPATDSDGEHEPYRQTLSESRLIGIIEEQDALFKEIETDPARRDQLEYERRLQGIATQYDSFLLDNPDYVYGYLLYGKFLRRIGENKSANNAFMKANMLDPNLAVAKQQIGNFLAEEGEYALALPYYIAAIDLEPEVPLYRYELGELLSHYRQYYIDNGVLTAETLDRNMLDAFHEASSMEPSNRDYHIRYAEAFFQVANPDWQDALNQWTILAKGVTDPLKLDLIRLQQARVLIEMGRLDEARKILASVDRSALQDAREELEARIASASARAQ
ncbi:hypothetical protein H5P28_19305 [Ruficoccus amylovorans]|uniref:Tetratricopeptide repeat protein n=1 Tax=Ruficoccus amylovorans TaxID=1804625 RepID=A0A842HJ21_9BACT|nr:hypothetical protein [Ruficoccus amylovorans]MBC2596422.1 hypothetical protein [Ruficoccus amylovorans]